MRKLLYICTAFPPAIGGGAVRNLLTARGLAERGWQVTVLTGDRRSPDWTDPSPLGSLPPTLRVVRASSPDVAAIARRRGAGGSGSARGGARAVRARLRQFALTWILIPDADAPWIPFAVLTGWRLLGKGGYDAMLTSGPPHSAHVVGRILSGRGTHWVVDSQDPWADHPFPSIGSRMRRRLDQWLESRVFGKADAVVAATESQTERFRAAHAAGRERFHTLPGGYDERDFSDAVPERSARRRILHVGSFYGARTPRGFIEALRSLARSDRALIETLEVVLAGYADAPSGAMITGATSDPLLQGTITYLPHVDRHRSISMMLGADLLLLVTDPGPGGRDLVPLKTFEYLRAGRPILALVPEGETARLLRQTGGAMIAPPDDPRQIETVLRRVLEGAAPAPHHPEAVSELSFDRTLDRLDELLRK